MAKKKFKYGEALVELTKKAIEESEILIDIFKNFNGAENMFEDMQRAHEIEHAGDEVNHEIYRQAAHDFITPIDREDLLLLSGNLDSVLDIIEVTIQHIYMFDVQKIHPDALSFAELVKKACVALHECAISLQNYKKDRQTIKQKIVDVNSIEESADELYMDVIRKLYTTEKDDPLKIMVWGNIFHNMEDCCDACEHATDVILSVLLKNS